MPGTRVSSERRICWLFFSEKNLWSAVYSLPVPAHPPNVSLESLEWIAALESWFDFRAGEPSLQLWKPSKPLFIRDIDRGWLKDHSEICKIARYVQPALSVRSVLGETWNPSEVHFLVKAEESPESISSITSETDFLPELPLNGAHRLLRGARKPISIPPFVAATSTERSKLQANPGTAIYDGFYVRGKYQIVDTVAPPVQVFHPVFQQFLDRIEDSTFKPSDARVQAVSEIMSTSVEIRPSESEAFNALRPSLSKLLGDALTQQPSARTCIGDGLVVKQLGKCAVPLVCIEYKRAFGEGGCDPSTQAAYSIRELLVSNEFKPIFEKCCCPCFLLAGGGPYLAILGVVFTEKFIVQRLTDIQWVGEATTHEDSRIYHLARVFESLRLAVVTLDEYYDQITKDQNIPPLVPNKPHPRIFPYPTRFIERGADAGHKWTDFEYIDIPRMGPTNITFFAKVKSSNRKLAIKFVGRYGVDAHELLARKEMAPRLLYCGSLDGKNDVRDSANPAMGSTEVGGLYVGPIRMVVMDYVEGNTMDKTPHPPEDARAQVERAVQTLHDAQLVFGDLRPPNIMISGSTVLLIDFDWAGKVNQARYPRNLSRSVMWPRRAEDLEFQPILMEHDKFMFNLLR